MDIETFGLEEESTVTLKFKIDQDSLLALVEKTSVVVPKADAIPVLANFKIQASASAVRIITTNLEISMVCATKEVEVFIAGEAYFPVRRFSEIVRMCPKNERILISVANQVATISSVSVVWTLNLHSGIGFPSLPEVTELQMKSVPRESLASGLQNTKYAAWPNPAKPNLMMICLRGGSAIACDGTRYHASVIPGLTLETQIPLEAVDDILKLLGSVRTDNVLAGEAANHIVFQTGSDILVINKLIAEFPDVSTLIGPAQRHQESFSVERDVLMTAIKQVKLSADIESPSMSFELIKNSLRLRTQDRFNNRAYATVEIERPASAMVYGTAVKCVLTLHYRMMLAALSSFECKRVVVSFGHDAKSRKFPILIRDEETGSFAVLSQLIS